MKEVACIVLSGFVGLVLTYVFFRLASAAIIRSIRENRTEQKEPDNGEK